MSRSLGLGREGTRVGAVGGDRRGRRAGGQHRRAAPGERRRAHPGDREGDAPAVQGLRRRHSPTRRRLAGTAGGDGGGRRRGGDRGEPPRPSRLPQAIEAAAGLHGDAGPVRQPADGLGRGSRRGGAPGRDGPDRGAVRRRRPGDQRWRVVPRVDGAGRRRRHGPGGAGGRRGPRAGHERGLGAGGRRARGGAAALAGAGRGWPTWT